MSDITRDILAAAVSVAEAKRELLRDPALNYAVQCVAVAAKSAEPDAEIAAVLLTYAKIRAITEQA